MSTYVVEVMLRHKDTHRTITTWVSVEAPYDPDWEATLTAAQLSSAHRNGWMPIKTTIVEMEA
jgi:hypothetical protein